MSKRFFILKLLPESSGSGGRFTHRVIFFDPDLIKYVEFIKDNRSSEVTGKGDVEAIIHYHNEDIELTNPIDIERFCRLMGWESIITAVPKTDS